jgi:hypothetical protein
VELTGVEAAPDRAVDTAAAAVLAAARLALGPDVELAGPPAVVPGGFGGGAYVCAGAGTAPPP